MKRSFLLGLSIFVSLAQSMPLMSRGQPLDPGDGSVVETGHATQLLVGAPQVSASKPDGTVDVIVEVQSSAEDLAKPEEVKKHVSSGVYDLRLFRDGHLVGSSIPRASVEKYIREAPSAVARDLAAKRLLNTDEDILWREANDLAKVISFDTSGKGTYTFHNIRLPRDGRKEVEFSAYAFNSDRVKSDTSRTTYPLQPSAGGPKKRLYLISVGVNAPDITAWKLKYAVKDAQVTQRALSERLGKQFEVVGVELVSDIARPGKLEQKDATKGNIRTVIDLLAGEKVEAADLERLAAAVGEDKMKRLGPSTPEDAVIITISSHGYADNTGAFYLLPSDIRKSVRTQQLPDLDSMISSDELNLWLRNVDAGDMVMIIDACHAAQSVQGSGFKPGPMGNRGLGQLAYDKRMRILSATQAANSALETGGDCQLGLLTCALVKDGLDKQMADFKPRDKTIWLTEWLEFAEMQVPKLFEKLEKRASNAVQARTVDVGKNSKKYLQIPKLYDFRKRNENDIRLSN